MLEKVLISEHEVRCLEDYLSSAYILTYYQALLISVLDIYQNSIYKRENELHN